VTIFPGVSYGIKRTGELGRPFKKVLDGAGSRSPWDLRGFCIDSFAVSVTMFGPGFAAGRLQKLIDVGTPTDGTVEDIKLGIEKLDVIEEDF
jgi:hypothetical protein